MDDEHALGDDLQRTPEEFVQDGLAMFKDVDRAFNKYPQLLDTFLQLVGENKPMLDICDAIIGREVALDIPDMAANVHAFNMRQKLKVVKGGA